MSDTPEREQEREGRGGRVGRGTLRESMAWQVAVIVLACAGVYWLGLGTKGLDFSEGHRCVPGWTMLRTGEWWHQEMFGLTYVRKPPGMAWAIGASAAAFGESAWSARAVSAASATLMGLIAWAYTRRWMGARWALVGGLAQALMPLMWSAGRSAEIEMLVLLGGQMMALGMTGLLVDAHGLGRGRPGRESLAPHDERTGAWLRGMGDLAMCAAGVVIAGLAKGPAAAPVLAGAIVGGAIGLRSWRVVFAPRLLGALMMGGGVLALLGMKFIMANQDAQGVREDVAGQFLWSLSRVGGVALLPLAAWASMLPMSAAVIAGVLAWWSGRRAGDADAARAGLAQGEGEGGGALVAGMLAWAWIVGIVVLVASGVSNARYAMVCAVVLPPLAAWGVKAVCERADIDGRARERLVWIGAGVLALAGTGLAIRGMFPTTDQRAGLDLAQRLSLAMPAGVTVWADDAIEARPDIVWEMQERSNRLGKGVRVHWAKQELLDAALPARGECVLLRTDAQSSEADRFKSAIVNGRLERLTSDKVRAHEYTLFRVRE